MCALGILFVQLTNTEFATLTFISPLSQVLRKIRSFGFVLFSAPGFERSLSRLCKLTAVGQ